jgi:type IV pilus assembly protein PilW
VSGGTTPSISGQPSDVLVLMSTGNDASQVPTPLSAVPQAAALPVLNISEFSPNDLLLLADKQFASGGGPANCLVSQAASTTPANGVSLPLGGTYYAATVSTRSVTDFTKQAFALDLGGATAGGTSLPPSFQVVGVGDNNTLLSYDLLGLTSPALQAQSEGVFEIHAVYGIDSTGSSSNKIDQWVKADSTSAYYANNLTDGSANALLLLKNIRAVRLGIIMRTALPERSATTTSTPDTLTMFSDLQSGTITFTRSMSAAEKLYRYRVIETTIPVRNNQY